MRSASSEKKKSTPKTNICWLYEVELGLNKNNSPGSVVLQLSPERGSLTVNKSDIPPAATDMLIIDRWWVARLSTVPNEPRVSSNADDGMLMFRRLSAALYVNFKDRASSIS